MVKAVKESESRENGHGERFGARETGCLYVHGSEGLRAARARELRGDRREDRAASE